MAPRARPPTKRPAEDPELAAGSAAHYEDAAYYQKTYARRTSDVDFYVDAAARAKGPVLEYGCGNGRITIPIARAGVEIFGIDLSKAMLTDLGERLKNEPADVRARVRTKLGDMRSVTVARKFAQVICPFNAFLHLYTRQDVERFLARVREHLEPKGSLVFDVSVPQPSELARKPEKLFRTKPFVYPELGRVKYGERFDYDGLRQVLFVSMEFEPESGADSFMTPLAHRQFYPQELEALLHYNGFDIETWIGDFDGKPTHETMTLALIARPR